LKNETKLRIFHSLTKRLTFKEIIKLCLRNNLNILLKYFKQEKNYVFYWFRGSFPNTSHLPTVQSNIVKCGREIILKNKMFQNYCNWLWQYNLRYHLKRNKQLSYLLSWIVSKICYSYVWCLVFQERPLAKNNQIKIWFYTELYCYYSRRFLTWNNQSVY